MRGLKRFLFKDDAPRLSEEVLSALSAWRGGVAPSLDEGHFHSRYVVLSIATSGVNPASDVLHGIAASTLHRGLLTPGDAFYVDAAGAALDDASRGKATDGLSEHQLLAFLKFSAKCPIVTFHSAFVAEFLQGIYKEKLGLDFQPAWIDLAWLLPSLFAEKCDTIASLEVWIDAFGLDAGSGRRSNMEHNLLLARVFQMVLMRAKEKNIDTAHALVQESAASCELLRNH